MSDRAERRAQRALDRLRREQVLGVLGLVGDVLERDASLGLAVEVAGRDLDAIVVEDEVAARRARENLVSRVRLVALAGLEQPSPLKSLAGSGILGYGVEIVRPTRLAWLALGDTLIVQDLATVARLGVGSHRFATVAGEVVERDGTITVTTRRSVARVG